MPLRQIGVRRDVPVRGRRACGAPTVPAFDRSGQVPGGRRAVDPNVPAPGGPSVLAIGPIDPELGAPNDLAHDRNVPEPAGPNDLTCDRNVPGLAGLNGLPLVPEEEPVVREILNARRRRDRGPKHDRNKEHARARERGLVSTRDRRRVRGHNTNTAPVLSKVHDPSRAPDRTTAIAAISGLGPNEVAPRKELLRR